MRDKRVIAGIVLGAVLIIAMVVGFITKMNEPKTFDMPTAGSSSETQEKPSETEAPEPTPVEDLELPAQEEENHPGDGSPSDTHASEIDFEEMMANGTAMNPQPTPETAITFAKNFATQWFTYNSGIERDKRRDQLSNVMSNPKTWAGVDPVAYYLGDARDNSEWLIISKPTAEPKIDPALTYSHGGNHYVTVDIPVTVDRTKGELKMSGSETMSLDITFSADGEVTDIAGAGTAFN